MERVTVPVHVAAYVTDQGELQYSAWSIQMTRPYIHIASTEVTVEVPKSIDPRFVRAEQLREEIKDIRARAEVEISNREHAIARLLCLEMEAPDGSDDR